VRILLDAWAILELIKGSDKGAKVEEIVRDSTLACTTSLNLYEAKYKLTGRYGEARIDKMLDEVRATTQILPITEEAALAAAEVKLQQKQLSAVDCNAYAVARLHKLEFVTGDKGFTGLEGVVLV
jgi:predicted nucleic acid-binding protein